MSKPSWYKHCIAHPGSWPGFCPSDPGRSGGVASPNLGYPIPPAAATVWVQLLAGTASPRFPAPELMQAAELGRTPQGPPVWRWAAGGAGLTHRDALFPHRSHRAGGCRSSQGLWIQRPILWPLLAGWDGAVPGRAEGLYPAGLTVPERLRLPALQSQRT